MSLHGHLANEQRGVDRVLTEFPEQQRWAEVVMKRIRRIGDIPPGARVLDVGAAAGSFVAACNDLGYACQGVEPWPAARETARELSQRLGKPIDVLEGSAEAIPLPDASFDVVHASSVIEHVVEIDRAIAEIFRVLKPNGVFWFNAASSMCPRQDEIRGFPLFGWYPNPLKLRIMHWVKDAKPALVGFSRTPAVNWFTPFSARALLERHGFRRVFDRWDLRGEDEGGPAYRAALRAIRAGRATKLVADVVVGGCSYAALK